LKRTLSDNEGEEEKISVGEVTQIAEQRGYPLQRRRRPSHLSRSIMNTIVPASVNRSKKLFYSR